MEEAKRPFIASAILTIPLRLKELPNKEDVTKGNIWVEIPLEESKEEIRKLGLLSYSHILDIEQGNDLKSIHHMQFYRLNKENDPTGMLTEETCTVKLNNKKEVNICFPYNDEYFWEKTTLVVFSTNHLALISLPVYVLNDNPSLTEDDELCVFNYLSSSIGYEKAKKNGIVQEYDAMPITCKKNNCAKNLNSIWQELMQMLDKPMPLVSKTVVSFISTYYMSTSKNYKENDMDLLKYAGKLAWTEKKDGFVIDENITPIIKLLSTHSNGKVYAACGNFGASIVSNYEKYDFKRRSQFYWIFFRIIIIRYSLHCMLDDVNNDFKKVSLEDNRDKYQEICKLRANYFYTEISDQYDTSRLYNLFYKGFKIEELNKEVEIKLNAIDEIISIEKDKKEEEMHQQDIDNDAQNSDIQAFISALVLVLTITSALNDFFDMIEDKFKIIPGIISMTVVIAVIIINWPRINKIFKTTREKS